MSGEHYNLCYHEACYIAQRWTNLMNYKLNMPLQLHTLWKKSVWFYTLICSFVVSTNIYRREFLCWMNAGDKTMKKTSFQHSQSFQSRFRLDWAPCSLACGCHRGRWSWVHELFSIIYEKVITYKMHAFRSVEEFDNMDRRSIKENDIS